MAGKKAIDLVLYGATGFTGKLACDYLASKPTSFSSSFKWAIAGRDGAKLEAVKQKLTEKFSHLDDLEVIVADSTDMQALDEMTAKCKAVVTFVGPYSKYGTKLMESCVKNGAHYADLTGELFWVKEMIEKHDEEAKQNKVKIIPTCGFDSVPSDWGAYCIAKIFREQLQEDTKHVKGVVWGIKGGFSGGTVASGFEMMSPENISKTMDTIEDPQTLNPPGAKNGLDAKDPDNVYWDRELKQYLGPFMMAPCNTRIVRRSNALNNYGPEFTYEEWAKCSSWLFAKSLAWGLYLSDVALATSWLRPLVKLVVPKPGQGPSEKDMPTGYARMKFFGESAKSGRKAVCDLTITGDPGYLVTSRMIVEAGIDMALNCEQNPSYGFQTPTSGLSEAYFDALLQNGFEVTTELVPEEKS
ncbi:putative trans-acting enoyl reductase Rv2449c [Convolutriloba macropyga]|uniref:putative trans-acting enoyl reductase Rv2449c n=1 Tax=Convolutriloba macropyga TaxID=536237 RepID=UPI003F526D95